MILKLGVILPHTKIFGGVKRFFEIGNLMVARGHTFIVFTPEGFAPDWFDFAGEVKRLDELEKSELHALFITEPAYMPLLKRSNARLKFFYAVLERSYIRKILRSKDLIVMANSTSLYRYLGGQRRSNLHPAIGGIDLQKFKYKEHPRNTPFTILVYGRFYRRKKGVMLVVKACEKLYRMGYDVKLLLFDTPVDEKSREKVREFNCKVPFEFLVDYPTKQIPELYYRADVFVSAERNAGWANTVAEAMACGVPVIATRSGTKDFVIDGETGLVVWRHPWFIRKALEKFYKDETLRTTLRKQGRRKIEGFSWTALTDTIEKMILERV